MKTTEKVQKFQMTHAEPDSPATGAIPGSAYEGPHGVMFRLGAQEGARPGPEQEALRLEAERNGAAALAEGADISDDA